jgi:hypothetical protein
MRRRRGNGRVKGGEARAEARGEAKEERHGRDLDGALAGHAGVEVL